MITPDNSPTALQYECQSGRAGVPISCSGNCGFGLAYNGTRVFGRRNNRRGNHAGQNYSQRFALLRNAYHFERIVPKSVFCKKYPEKTTTFGEHLRKARIDAGLLIKDLAAKLGVTKDTVITWEIRGRMPRPGAMEALERVFVFVA